MDNKELNTDRRKEADEFLSLMERLQVRTVMILKVIMRMTRIMLTIRMAMMSIMVMQEEERRHKEHVERVMARLRQEKGA